MSSAVCCAVVLILAWTASSVPLHPIVLTHGLYGAQLLYTVDKRLPESPIACPDKPVNETLWLNILNFLDPVSKACFMQASSLHYENKKRRSFPAPGVKVTTTTFGETEGVEWLAPVPQRIKDTSYYFYMIQRLETLSYVKGKNLKAAQYDWRRAPNENKEWIRNTKRLIENMYSSNNMPVIFIVHSMGSQFSYIFLNQMGRKWCNKYIRSWILLSSNFGGSFKPQYEYFAYDDYPSSLSPATRPPLRTYSTTAFLLPRIASYGNETLVKTSTAEYKAEDYKQFFQDLGYKHAYDQWKDVKSLYDPNHMRSPGDFSVYCVAGFGLQTLERTVFNGPLDMTTPFEAVYGDGDSFVGAKSLRLCYEMGKGKANFGLKEFPGLDHLQIIRDDEPIQYVTGIVNSINYGVEKFSNEFN